MISSLVFSEDGSNRDDFCCGVSCESSSLRIFVVPCLDHLVKDGPCDIEGDFYFHALSSSVVGVGGFPSRFPWLCLSLLGPGSQQMFSAPVR